MFRDEDNVLLDTLLLIVTAPVWIAGFVVLVVAGAVGDWRANG